jgi:thiol:disulfide interchange protein DsbD
MANLLIVFALAMLDVLPVRVPQTVLRRASEAGRSGGVAGAFAMGAASGLVAAPCGAPVMAAVLTWVSLTKSALLGFMYLFVFSLGMTALLVAVGLSTGLLARLPRAGVWMIWIKRIFALLMFVVAEYYLIEMGKLLL